MWTSFGLITHIFLVTTNKNLGQNLFENNAVYSTENVQLIASNLNTVTLIS